MDFSEQIIKVLNDLSSKFGMAIDWSSENILPYLKDLCSRLVNYEVLTSIAWIIIFILIIAVLGVTIYFDIKKDISDGMIAFFSGLLIFACLVGVSKQAFDIIKAKTVPETIIIEQIDRNIYNLKK